jgi:hypothetical protein
MREAVHREIGTYLVEPEPPKENPCQVPWGCVHKKNCRNPSCHYGQLNIEAQHGKHVG